MSSSSYGKTVGGKLKLKGGVSLAAAPRLAGAKRARDEGAVAAPAAAAAAAAAPPTAAAAVAPAQRIQGAGRVTTSGTTVHGVDTNFLDDLLVGDAIQLTNPLSRKDEVRVVRMVLSRVSAGVNAPFSSDIVAGTPFHVLKLPRATEDAAAVGARAAAEAKASAAAAFGTYAGDGAAGTMTYLVKKGGSYAKLSAEAGGMSREQMLDARAKYKSDKFA